MRAVVPITVAPRAIGIVRVAVIAEAGTPAAGGTEAAAERPASPHAAAVIVDPGGEVGFADRAADADAQIHGLRAMRDERPRGDDGHRRGDRNEALAHSDLLHSVSARPQQRRTDH